MYGLRVPSPTLVVLNPVSRGGRRAQWEALEGRLCEVFGTLEVEATRGPGDATRIAREAARAGVERVLVAGGDGTVSETVSGLLATGLAGSVELGLLPFGTGGDFARAIGMPSDPIEAVDVLAAGKPRPVDAGRIRMPGADGVSRTRWFANETSVGVSGDVVARVRRGPRWLSGQAAFFWATLRAVWAYAPDDVRLEVDGSEVFAGLVALACASNAGWFGGGMHIAPEARFDDGLLDVVVVRGVPGLRLLPRLRKLYAGTHLSDPAVCAFRGRKVRFEARAGTPAVEVDGELGVTLPLEIDVLPGALTVLAPRG